MMTRIAIACIVATMALSSLAARQPAALAALQQRIERLEALTDRVEALSAIKRLQHAYGHYSELGLWHDFADLFADTGVGYYTQGALDREGIRQLFLKEVGQGRLGLADGRVYPHISMQPMITLSPDGQSADGRWHLLAMLGGYGTSASWSGGVYTNKYVRENGVWKMQEVRYVQQWGGRYEAAAWTPAKERAAFQVFAPRVDALLASAPVTPPAQQDLPALAQRMAALQARAERAGHEIEVTNLQHRFGYFADRRQWDDAAKLFADDATLEIGASGVYAGRASVRRGLNLLGPAGIAQGEINDQVHLQTIVTVSPDGHTARVRGGAITMTGAQGDKALLGQVIYENEFVKQAGTWMFSAMHVYPRFRVDANVGWARDAQPAPEPSRAFPPDRPSTGPYAIFPRFHIAPFHFDHPVTGRAPQYPEGTATAVRRPTAAQAQTAVKTAAALAALVTATERSLARSSAYYASENAISAHGFSLDESAWTPTSFAVHQLVQPVIDVSADGRRATIRARLFQPGNADGEGLWTSGSFESRAADEKGTWRLLTPRITTAWSAPARGGWTRIPVVGSGR